jgi:hypothetical protein
LPAIVSEHLFGRLILAYGNAVHFDGGLSRRTAEQIGADQITRVIVHEGDQVRVATSQPEGEDVALPHLIGCRPFEEARPSEVPLLGRLGGWHQLRSMQCLANSLRTGFEEKHPAQDLRDTFDPEDRLLLFEFDDLIADRTGQFCYAGRTASPVN